MSNSLKTFRYATILVLLAMPPLAEANDTMASISAGGIRFVKTEKISMLEENLSISLDEIKVRYLFKNHSSRDIKTTIAFPVPEYTYSYASYYSHYPQDFNDFKVIVDGKKVPFETTVQALFEGRDYAPELEDAGVSVVDFGNYDPANDGDDIRKMEGGDRFRFQFIGVIGPKPEPDWPQWTVKVVYHWEQVFPANKTIEIEHSYSPYYGGHLIGRNDMKNNFSHKACLANSDLYRLLNSWPVGKWGSHDYVPYILTTGGNWKGSIGQFTLEIDQPKDTIAGACFPEPLYLNAQGKKFATVNNFTPTKDLTVYFFKSPPQPPATTTIATRKADHILGPHSRFPHASNGPVLLDDEQKGKEGQGVYWRITTTVEEIYVVIYFEKLSVGKNGCCETRLSLRMFENYDFADYYYLIGEFTSFSVKGWVSPTSFIASSMGKTFLFSDIDNDRVTVSRITEQEQETIQLSNPDDEVVVQGDSRDRVKNAITEISE